MKPDHFGKPVRILVGLGRPRDIRSALDAYMFLDEAPGYMRNSAHAMALKACRAALMGEVEAQTARGAFEAFVRKHDLLAPEIDHLASSSGASGRNGPHVG